MQMREAPCSSAPAVKSHGQSVTIPQGATFKYLDRNSRQSENCATYGFVGNPDETAPSYCWVLGQYQGVTGWVPVQKLEPPVDPNIPPDATLSFPWLTSLCDYLAPDNMFLVFGQPPELLVSDDGSATGCAQLTPALNVGCFPAVAWVRLRGGANVRMSQLALGDEVAVLDNDGSVTWSAVYAFGHRDDSTPSEFVEITGTAEAASTSSIQVCDCCDGAAHCCLTHKVSAFQNMVHSLHVMPMQPLPNYSRFLN